MIAGPSEILVVADETADPRFVAADLMSQAEHDVLASAMLLTPAKNSPTRWKRRSSGSCEPSRADIIKQSLRDFGAIILCSDIQEMVELANEIAPEHLKSCWKSDGIHRQI